MKRPYSFKVQQYIQTGAFVVSLGLFLMIANPGWAQEIVPVLEPSGEATQQVVALNQTESLPGFAVIAAATGASVAAAPGEDFDEDPWEGFNEKMFWFNREVLDRYILKPVATGWDFIFPDPVQRGVHNFFDNLAVVRRVVNNTLQLKLTGAGTELARFTINSTIGLVGFFDVAKDAFGIEQRDEDTGQTFGVWGMGPGPYLVLPLLPPLTVRDGVGYALDAAMTPYTYFIPWWGTVAGSATSTVNERSLNLDRFERISESTVDLYGAVRNAYLQRRAAQIKQ
jgi:phospholipid-binding lipoprotein MlaA